MNNVALSNEFLSKYQKIPPEFGFNGLGYVVFKRTYARIVENENRTEEWWETVQRCVDGAQKLGADYTQEELEEFYDLMFHMKVLPPGRGLWQMGTKVVDKIGGNSLINCYFAPINKLDAFTFAFENLMLGGGVGFSVKRSHVYELPRVKEGVKITCLNVKDADFIVPDTREGWVELLRRVLDSYFNTGKSFSYSTMLIRPAGEPIKSFGGTASGAKILVDGIANIGSVIDRRAGKKLRSIDALDIMNIIGAIVVSGNVRRSAQLAIGDPDDLLFLRAKRWDLGNIPNWRAMSNNSIDVENYDDIPQEFWKGYEGNGEPYGLVNTSLCKKYGRIGEEIDDNGVEGLNPCGEATLAPYEVCNLGELILPKITSKEELWRCTYLIYKYQKAVCNLTYIHKETEAVVKKNQRIGVSVTGIAEAMNKISWLEDNYDQLKKFDKLYSKNLKINKSIKLTVIKPSGTVSLIPGVTPGVHPAFADYYIRRVRMSSSDSLVSTCRDAGFTVEYVKNFDGTDNRDTVVVEFPCKSNDNAVRAKDMTAIQQLELAKKMNTVWVDQNTSLTVYYHKEELMEIKEWLKHNFSTIKGVSFLLHSEHGFAQAPYEEIDQKTYDKLVSKVNSSFYVKINGNETIDELECASGACPIR